MTEAQWIDAFTTRMGNLGVRANPEMIADMARELYETQGHLNPVEIADAEYAQGPPHDD